MDEPVVFEYKSVNFSTNLHGMVDHLNMFSRDPEYLGWELVTASNTGFNTVAVFKRAKKQ